jgi:hypothetical protein
VRAVKKAGVTAAFGVSAAAVGYILVRESVLPAWAALVLVAGGCHGAVVGVNQLVGPFGPIRQRVVNLVFGLVVFVPALFFPFESILVFASGVSLVCFGMLLQDVVSDAVETGA